jgi:hypothetical protein
LSDNHITTRPITPNKYATRCALFVCFRFDAPLRR